MDVYVRVDSVALSSQAFDVDTICADRHAARELIDRLRHEGKQIRFTSDEMVSREALQAKIARYGIKARAEECFGLPIATASYLTRHRYRRVYLIGGPALEDALTAARISFSGRGDDDDNYTSRDPMPRREIDYSIQAVVIGHEKRLNHVKLTTARTLLKKTGCPLVVTFDPDQCTRKDDAESIESLLPDAARVVCTPKPHSALFESLKINASRTLIIGPDSDASFAQAVGAHHCTLEQLVVA